MVIYYRDERGNPTAIPDGEHPLIASFIDTEMRAGPSSCQEILDIIEEVKDGRRPEWSGTFNAHVLTVRSDDAAIENLWDENLGVAHISLELLRDCIKDWEAFLSS